MITKVEPLHVCRERHYDHKGKPTVCNTPMVRVTFNSGRTAVVHDDGSFIVYTGEQG